MSGQEGFLGAFDVSPTKPDPPELAQRPSHLAAQIRAQFLARAERLCLCRAARPAQPEDLRAVHAAAPVKAPDRICPAPPLHRLGPFLGRVVLRESLQGADELAVDDPGRERVEIPGDRRHPNLVEQREALLDITVEDQQPRFCHSTEGARRRVKPRTQLDGPLRPRSGAGQVAGQHALIRPNHRKPSARRSLGLTVQEPLGSCQPAPHRRHQGGIEEQVHRHANRRTCRRVLVAGLHAQRVRALPRFDGHVEMPRRVGDLAKDPKIGGAHEAVRVRLREELERRAPISSRCRITCPLDEGLDAVGGRNRGSYSRNGLAHAYGLRTTTPRTKEKDPCRA